MDFPNPSLHRPNQTFVWIVSLVGQIIQEGPDAPSSTGFSSIVKSSGFGNSKEMRSTRYRMHAPGVIRIRSEGKKEGEPLFGAALHCIPLGKGRSRLLFKVFSVGVSNDPSKGTVVRSIVFCVFSTEIFSSSTSDGY